ncbi:MAG: thioredoxin family protein [Chloroflexota bacterium]
METVKTIEASQFDSEILASDIPIIVDFYGADCVVCDAVAQWEVEMLPVRKIFLSYPTFELAQRYHLRGIPTLIRFEDGEETGRMAGSFSQSGVQDFVSASSNE